MIPATHHWTRGLSNSMICSCKDAIINYSMACIKQVPLFLQGLLKFFIFSLSYYLCWFNGFLSLERNMWNETKTFQPKLTRKSRTDQDLKWDENCSVLFCFLNWYEMFRSFQTKRNGIKNLGLNRYWLKFNFFI
jgi:hypothetical protein